MDNIREDGLTDKIFLGIDAGGTFTDFCLVQLGKSVKITLHKTLSTPSAPEQAIINGISALGLDSKSLGDRLHIIHGSTVATNAALEGNLAKTAYITNRGFKDVLTLARQTRPKLYSLEFPEIKPPVQEGYCLETGGRITHKNEVLDPLTSDDLDELVKNLKRLDVEAVAVNLLFSFVDDKFETQISNALEKEFPDLFISRSSTVLPVYKEYERGIATWLNAALGPVVFGYLDRLQKHLGKVPLQIMQSSGETIAAQLAAKSAVNLLLSGPAGGLTALRYIGQQIGQSNFISFDMGGTSTDVALLEGAIETTDEGYIGVYPVGVPMVDMHTIGAGGGSIAYIDAGGILQVGPKSAGASPGPACYGLGGIDATVTDANLVLGRLSRTTQLAGNLTLDFDAASTAIKKLATQMDVTVEEAAEGIVRIANQHMATALRLISVNRGHNPQDFTMVCFGGAGGLHVCELAESMLMTRAIVPVHGGVLSALGMVVADRGRQFSKTINIIDSPNPIDIIDAAFRELEKRAIDDLSIELRTDVFPERVNIERSAQMRYVGQSFTLNVPYGSLQTSKAAFEALHVKRYGYQLENEVEIVTLRVSPKIAQVSFDLPIIESTDNCNISTDSKVYGCKDAKLWQRSDLALNQRIVGPAIITEYSATTYIAEGWSALQDQNGNLMLEK